MAHAIINHWVQIRQENNKIYFGDKIILKHLVNYKKKKIISAELNKILF